MPDCNIYVSKRAGERVITRFLESKLILRVNQAVAHVQRPPFGDSPGQPETRRIRQITRRNRGVSMETVIGERMGTRATFYPMEAP
jgi:hypothetical protein